MYNRIVFKELEMLIPKIKKANEDIGGGVGEEQRIDVRLEKVEDSESDGEGEGKEEGMGGMEGEGMDDEMVDESD